jgi:hypothetical protein
MKQFAILASGLGILLSSTTAFAIAPGTRELAACGRFTATRYKVSESSVQARPVERTNNGWYVDWSVPRYRSSGYCFVRPNGLVSRFQVERGPRPDQIGGSSGVGPNERYFSNLPSPYGDSIVNRGQGASGDRQYFLVRKVSTGRNYRFSARCANNPDQVYDESGKYVGFQGGWEPVFNYVCEVSPLRPRPPRPQPR